MRKKYSKFSNGFFSSSKSVQLQLLTMKIQESNGMKKSKCELSCLLDLFLFLQHMTYYKCVPCLKQKIKKHKATLARIILMYVLAELLSTSFHIQDCRLLKSLYHFVMCKLSLHHPMSICSQFNTVVTFSNILLAAKGVQNIMLSVCLSALFKPSALQNNIQNMVQHFIETLIIAIVVSSKTIRS